jgi:hypothetical protein
MMCVIVCLEIEQLVHVFRESAEMRNMMRNLKRS